MKRVALFALLLAGCSTLPTRPHLTAHATASVTVVCRMGVNAPARTMVDTFALVGPGTVAPLMIRRYYSAPEPLVTVYDSTAQGYWYAHAFADGDTLALWGAEDPSAGWWGSLEMRTPVGAFPGWWKQL